MTVKQGFNASVLDFQLPAAKGGDDADKMMRRWSKRRLSCWDWPASLKLMKKRALGIKMIREGWSEDVFTEGQ